MDPDTEFLLTFVASATLFLVCFLIGYGSSR